MSDDDKAEAEIRLANQLAMKMAEHLGGQSMVVASTALTEVVAIWLRASTDEKRDWPMLLATLFRAAHSMADEIPDEAMRDAIVAAKRKHN
jgi:hypothetical protein